MNASISFHGAAETVTGSKHLLEVNGKKILIDCGLFQGARETRAFNWEPFTFDPTELDAVIVTHAHVDHIGLLPKLVREGYKGPIYATAGTMGICKFSLPDSGRLQEEDARHHNKHRTSRHEPALPLYTEEDAYAVLMLIRSVLYNQMVEIGAGCTIRFLPAGHILGSAMVEIYLPNGEKLLMGGDLGRFDTPIITDPTMVDAAEYLVVESTYGDRLHTEEDTEARLKEVILSAVESGSTVLVPSFAIGRTQELLFAISQLQIRGEIPEFPIYLDSPMAVSATNLYQRNSEDHDIDMKAILADGIDPLHPKGMQVIRDRNASKALNQQRGPMMVIAGSGMCNGGRIQHHLKARIDDPSTVVLFVGYQATGTLGRELLEGTEFVKIFGEELEVKARIERMTSLSAHADQAEIMHWLRGFKHPPKTTFIVHGEPEPRQILAQKVRDEFGWNVETPLHHQSFPLG